MTEMGYAEVIVDLPLSRVDQLFHYVIPEHLKKEVAFGVRVKVPFGKRHLSGYVVGLLAKTEVQKLKEIKEVLDSRPAFNPELWALARWMARRYLCTTSQALQCIVAPARQSSTCFRNCIQAAPLERPEQLTVKQQQAWSTAQSCPGLTNSELASRAGVSSGVVKRLLDQGALVSFNKPVFRGSHLSRIIVEQGWQLNLEQQRAAEAIITALERQQPQKFLLYGITGSGKTEVYLHAAAASLKRGRQVLVLVPEIALAGQIIPTFKNRFGSKVAVLHSRLGAGERYDEWHRIAEGKAPIVVGARSAIFAPLTNLGLIVLDEEHEPGYKQEEIPRYITSEVAKARANKARAVIVAGSATPSLRTYAEAVQGNGNRLLKLTKRVEGKPLPHLRVVDLRAEYKAGNKYVFSRYLASKINEKVALGQQVLLFLNRRGLATIVLCRDCGKPLFCPHCAISLTYHNDGSFHCHYCGFQTPSPQNCPACGSNQVKRFGVGTQRIEAETNKLFPGARTLRLDGDTVTAKESHGKIINEFREGKADILIGTQMIAKGLNLPNVTLVGIINADTTLLLPDYLSAERTYQLITQVAGRAGRGEITGEVVVQTHRPDHYSIKAALCQDYEGFYKQEMQVRRSLSYPPYTALARVLLRAKDCATVRVGALKMREIMVKQEGPLIEILGPAPPPVAKINQHYRQQIIVRSGKRKVLRELLRSTLRDFDREVQEQVLVSVDIEPQNFI